MRPGACWPVLMASRSPCGFIDMRGGVTIEAGGARKIGSIDAKTLKPTGRLRFATEP